MPNRTRTIQYRKTIVAETSDVYCSCPAILLSGASLATKNFPASGNLHTPGTLKRFPMLEILKTNNRERRGWKPIWCLQLAGVMPVSCES